MNPFPAADTPYFVSLASGSKGNAFYVGTRDRGVLIEAGVGPELLNERMAVIGLSMDALQGCLITHEHGDHAQGLRAILKVKPMPVLASRGTLQQIGPFVQPFARPLGFDDLAEVAGLRVSAHPVPHDARQPRAFRIHGHGISVGFVTDMGHPCPRLAGALQGVDCLYVEANYDPDLLFAGPYPQWLKERIAGKRGHASNAQTAELLMALGLLLPRIVVLGHLSETNNAPALARAAVEPVLRGRGSHLELVTQDTPFALPLVGPPVAVPVVHGGSDHAQPADFT